MDFRITSGTHLATEKNLQSLKTVYLGENLKVEASSWKSEKCISHGGLYIVIGSIYGFQSTSGRINQLTNIFSYLSSASLEELENKIYKLEGTFAILYIKDDQVSIYLDKYSKYDVFYNNNNGAVSAGTRLDYLSGVGDSGYHQESLVHTLTYYGFRPPKQHTIYNDVKRIGVGEMLKIERGSIQSVTKQHKQHETSNFTIRDNKEYVEHFLHRLETTGSKEGNVVFLSSGWDSTSILAGLVHIFGKRKVSAIVGRMKFSERSGVCNQFEISKAKKFAEYYDIPIDVVDFEYLDNGPEFINQHKDTLKHHQLYNMTAFSHSLLCRKASEIAKGKSIFAGEISDGAHNLGFSQYATIFHKDYEFRQYSDKMASYLYGPTFYQQFIDGNKNDDVIYKFLGDLKGDVILDEGHTKKDFLVSFFLRNGRYPGWSMDNVAGVTKNGGEKYTSAFYDHYMSSAESNLTANNLYSWYLHLYNSFHWQGSSVSTLPLFAKQYDVTLDLPFWDANIQDFLSEMPENWGRGLDLNPTKFPLKWMLENKLDYPMDLQIGPHAYTYDVDHGFNHGVEVFYHSKMKTYFQNAVKDRPYHALLDKDYFNIDYYDGLVEQYLQNKEMKAGEFNDLVPLVYLSYIGWH